MSIQIIYYEEAIDNWGRKESTFNQATIYSVLTNPSDWSDDMLFTDATGRVYFIDDLLGKDVVVDGKEFVVVDNAD